MNRILAASSLFLAAAASVAAPSLYAQQSTAAPALPPEQVLPSTTPLAITILAAPVAKGETPLFATITLTNTSDHDVKLPQPEIGCIDSRHGFVTLQVQFAAASAPQSQAPCAETSALAESAAPENPAAHWLMLAPGDTANFAQRILTPASDNTPGAYTLRGSYTPPQISPAAAERLYSLSISYPTEPLTSAPVTISPKHNGESETAGLLR
jgi:hypothetical protein